MQRASSRLILLVAASACLGAGPALAASTQTQAPSVPAPHVHSEGATTLLVENKLPWGTDSNERVLADLGVPYDRIGGKDFASLDLSPYSTIILASVQTAHFYANVGKHMDAIDAWLRHGARTLEVHAARYSITPPWDFELPGGVGTRLVLADDNYLSGVDSPLVSGLPQHMTGNYASHIVFVGRKPLDDRVLIVTSDKQAVMVDYCVGPGRVIATGQTVEYGWGHDWDFAQVLPNMLSASTLTPGCPH